MSTSFTSSPEPGPPPLQQFLDASVDECATRRPCLSREDSSDDEDLSTSLDWTPETAAFLQKTTHPPERPRVYSHGFALIFKECTQKLRTLFHQEKFSATIKAANECLEAGDKFTICQRVFFYKYKASALHCLGQCTDSLQTLQNGLTSLNALDLWIADKRRLLYAKIYGKKAKLLTYKKNYEDAAKAAKQGLQSLEDLHQNLLLQLSPFELADFFKHKAVLCCFSQDYKESLRSAAEGLTISGINNWSRIDLYYRMAVAYNSLNRSFEAIAAVEKGIACLEEDDFYNQLKFSFQKIHALFALGKFAKAKDVAEALNIDRFNIDRFRHPDVQKWVKKINQEVFFQQLLEKLKAVEFKQEALNTPPQRKRKAESPLLPSTHPHKDRRTEKDQKYTQSIGGIL